MIRTFNGVKLEIVQTPGVGSADIIKLDGEAIGSMTDTWISIRVYSKEFFRKIRTAFPNLGWEKDVSRVHFHTSFSASESSESDIDLLV